MIQTSGRVSTNTEWVVLRRKKKVGAAMPSGKDPVFNAMYAFIFLVRRYDLIECPCCYVPDETFGSIRDTRSHSRVTFYQRHQPVRRLKRQFQKELDVIPLSSQALLRRCHVESKVRVKSTQSFFFFFFTIIHHISFSSGQSNDRHDKVQKSCS